MANQDPLKTFRFTVEYLPDSNSYVIYVAGAYYTTAGSPADLAAYLSLKKLPKVYVVHDSAHERDQAILDWLRKNTPKKCPDRFVAPSQAASRYNGPSAPAPKARQKSVFTPEELDSILADI